MTELLPCPFCGSQNPGVGSSLEEENREWSVLCPSCGASCSLCCETEAEAIKLWNTREPAPRCEVRSETLEALVREYARDLRRNSSGGDLSADEQRNNEFLADYLEELIKRATRTADTSEREVVARIIEDNIYRKHNGNWDGDKEDLYVAADEILAALPASSRSASGAEGSLPFLCPCCGARGTTDGNASTVASAECK